jgi:hypothetical protein
MLGIMVYAYNPIYVEGIGKKIAVWGQTQAQKQQSVWKKLKQKRTGVMA